MLLSENNIKSELSYAYLHAVVSRAGCSATYTDRHTDGTGVDAVIRARQQFADDSIYTNFSDRHAFWGVPGELEITRPSRL